MKTIGWQVEHRTGLVYFNIVIDLIQTSSPKNIRYLVVKVGVIKIKDFDGKSIII